VNIALAVDLVAFTILLALSALVRSRFKHHRYSATAAFGMVMAIGIFTDFSLPQLPFYSPLLARLVTLELLVIGLFLTSSYISSALNHHFRMHVAHPLRRFAIGTWVAGTALLSVLVTHTLPEMHLLDTTLAIVAIVVYLPYVALFVHGYYKLLRHPLKQNANGVILLATVSTQSIVIALHSVFADSFPINVAIGLVAFDMIFLCSGLVLVALHYYTIRSWLLAIEWKNANCIVHGAVSITGLTLVLTSNFGPEVLLDVWEIALVLFVIIETLEFVRLCEREYSQGLRKGLLVYDVTQWTRNFTYGMFYALSLALYRHLAMASTSASNFWYSSLRVIVEWGQYVVLAFLLIEVAIFLRARLHLFWHSAYLSQG